MDLTIINLEFDIADKYFNFSLLRVSYKNYEYRTLIGINMLENYPIALDIFYRKFYIDRK